jgi:bacterial/archaeal transporter family-2 protein
LNPQQLLYALSAVAVGTLFPVQTAANALLAKYIGGPIAATIVSFATGLVMLLAINALAFRQWPSLADVTSAPWPLLLIGGAIGAVFLSSNVFLAPRLGAAATLCFVIAGQLSAALVIDRMGLFGFALREATPGRVAGVAMVLVGAVLVRLL